MDCLVAVLAVRAVQADPVAYPPFLALEVFNGDPQAA